MNIASILVTKTRPANLGLTLTSNQWLIITRQLSLTSVSWSRMSTSTSTSASGTPQPPDQPRQHPSPPPDSSGRSNTGAGAAGTSLSGKWDLFAAVVLERRPLLTQMKVPLEHEYSNLLGKYEFELSKKSSHEVRKEKDRIVQEKIKSGELDADAASSQTAQDQEDLWATELNQFKPASRTTEADKKQDQKSLNRALDSHLVLVIEQKLGPDYKWICPHGKWQYGETLYQTTERVLKELCPELKTKVLGHAPWGFYKYKYPKKVITGQSLPSIGAKVFFYKAQVLSGDASSPKILNDKEHPLHFRDYLWLTREELNSKLNPDYHRQISEFLIEETN